MLLERLESGVRLVARGSAYGGALALVGCVAVTVLDVVLRNFFGTSVFGAVEYVQLGVMWAAFLTIPLGFAYGDHIAVDVFVTRAGDGTKRVLKATNMLVAALAMAACLWWGGAQALHALVTRDITLTAGIPLWLFWVPILFGMGLAVVAALVVALRAAAGWRVEA